MGRGPAGARHQLTRRPGHPRGDRAGGRGLDGGADGRGGPLGRSGTGRPAAGTAVRVLVTGASGMLGSATARALAARGDRVTVLQRRASGLGLPEVLADVAD